MRTPRYSVKRTDGSVPLVPGLMRSLACLSRKIVGHCGSIKQLDITIALVESMHSILASGQPFLQAYSNMSKGEV